MATENLVCAAALGEIGALDALPPTDVNRQRGPWRAPLLIYACASPFLHSTEYRPRILAFVQALVGKGADPNATWINSDFPDSPLSALYAATGISNEPELAELLLARGANPNDNESLYHSAEHRDLACMRLLVAAGARFPGSNALRHMLDYDDLEGLRFCLDNGADANDPGDTPPLHHALMRGRSELFIRLLLERGANAQARDAHGVSAYRLAKRLGNTGAAAAIEAHGGAEPLSRIDEFIAACAAGDETAARQFPYAKLIAAMGPNELRALPDQAELGRYESVRIMLALGFPVGAQGSSWASALNQACFRGDLPMVRLLLAHGARWDEPNAYGGNAMGSVSFAWTNSPREGGDYRGVFLALMRTGAEPPENPERNPELHEALEEFRQKKRIST